jgi:predicted permease
MSMNQTQCFLVIIAGIIILVSIVIYVWVQLCKPDDRNWDNHNY